MNKIKELLEKKGMTQRELADRVGVTEVSMSRYINGDRTPKGPIAAMMARVLDADITDVIDIGDFHATPRKEGDSKNQGDRYLVDVLNTRTEIFADDVMCGVTFEFKTLDEAFEFARDILIKHSKTTIISKATGGDNNEAD